METDNAQQLRTFGELIGFHHHQALDYPEGASYLLDVARQADAQRYIPGPRLVEPGVKTYAELLLENKGRLAMAKTVTTDYFQSSVA